MVSIGNYDILPFYQARKDTAQQILSRLGPHAILVSSAEHDDVIAGQGTVAMEFLEQVIHHMVATVLAFTGLC